MEEGLKRSLTVAGAKAAYDEHVKQILARKIVLAHLLVGVVPEYAGMEQMCNLSEAIEEEGIRKGILREQENTERERRRAEEESRRAEQESHRAEQESRRAEQAEEEIARLKLEVNRLKRSISL